MNLARWPEAGSKMASTDARDVENFIYLFIYLFESIMASKHQGTRVVMWCRSYVIDGFTFIGKNAYSEL